MTVPSAAIACALLWCVTGSSAAAFAQPIASDRPFRGLFGRGSQGTGGHSLDLTATLLEAYDSDLVADAGTVAASAPKVSGHYTMLQTAGRYGWASSAVQFEITGASAFRSYGSLGETNDVSHSAGVGLSGKMTRRTTVALNQSFAYSPSYLYGLFPSVADVSLGEATPIAPDYDVDDTSSRSLVSSASVDHAIGQRTAIAVELDYNATDFTDALTERRNTTTYGAQAAWSRRLRRHASFDVEYRYRRGEFALSAGDFSTEQGVRIGFENTKVLSASRRARFSFGGGVSQAEAPADLAALTPRDDKVYRFAGDAAVEYQFSRTGEIRASYRRGVEYLAELSRPVFVDGVSAEVVGSLTRRWNVAVSGGYSSGASALYATSSFDTYTGEARSQFALTSVVGLSLHYLYYFYDFRGTALLTPGLPRRFERNGLRVGLTFSTPVIRR